MILPNFVILGAPKCGTSSLFNWLAVHPDVSASIVKEPFFLMDPDHPLRRKPGYFENGLGGYTSLFPKDAIGYRIRMEGTTHYLYQKTALQIVPRLPDVRACVVLRDPAERIYSSFNYTKHNLGQINGDISFSQFLSLIENKEPLYPVYCGSPKSAYVLERDIENSRYAHYLRLWLDALGYDRLKIVLFDDLKMRPKTVLKDICTWLDLDPRDLPDTAIPCNQTIHIRLTYLHRFLLFLNLHRFLGPLKPCLKKIYLHLQRRKNLADPETSESIAKLRTHFFQDVNEVQKLLGRELNSWYPRSL